MAEENIAAFRNGRELADGELLLDRMEQGLRVAADLSENRLLGWSADQDDFGAEFVLRQPTPVAVDGKEVCRVWHYSRIVKAAAAKHELFCAGKLE